MHMHARSTAGVGAGTYVPADCPPAPLVPSPVCLEVAAPAMPRETAATLASFNIPEAGLLLIIGIDQFLDMGRSATNVIGNTLATAVVAKWEGEKVEHPTETIVVIDPARA